MAASGSHASSSTIHAYRAGRPATMKKLNDAVYEFYKPEHGSIDLEVVFFHGFQSEGNQEAYLSTWMVADGSECWLNSWLPQKFPQARILSVCYDSSVETTESNGGLDMYLVGENLAQCIIDLAGVGRACPVILVGHCVGGLVLKEVCCRTEQMSVKFSAEGNDFNPYASFLTKLEGVFFYSTAQAGVHAQISFEQQSPLATYYELLNHNTARLNSDFSELRRRDGYRWKTFGANQTEKHERSTVTGLSKAISPLLQLYTWKPRAQSLPTVEEGSARYDMDGFCVLPGEDNLSVCKPKDETSDSFQLLVRFIQEIVEILEWTKNQWRSILQFPREYVRMPKRIRKVIDFLKLDEEQPSRVSLVGMGGIGKTTLAKEVFVEIRSQFEFACFVENVKKKLKQQNLEVHTLVAQNLFSNSGLRVGMHRNDYGPEFLLRCLKGRKVLLILDDVDSEEQMSSLLLRDWVAKGSRLVITSRVRSHEMPSFVVYKVPFLSEYDSQRLFRAHIDGEVIEKVQNDLINQIVAKCNGLVLTLQIMGSYLRFVRDTSIWKGTVIRLTEAESLEGSESDILWAKIRISFEDLGPSEKRMFLDVAGFDRCESAGKQYDVSIWRSIWMAEMDAPSISIGLRNLSDRSFWFVRAENHLGSSNGRFVYIHEQLRDFGRSILRPPRQQVELCRGLWRLSDAEDLLLRFKGDTAPTEIISVRSDRETRWSSLERLQRLRLLRISGVGTHGNHRPYFPYNLVCIHMLQCFKRKAKGFSRIVDSACWPLRAQDIGGLHKLKVLLLEGCSSIHLPQNFHELKNLSVLIVRDVAELQLPKKFGLLPSLEMLVLERVGLRKIPASFHHLSTLQELKISDCPVSFNEMISTSAPMLPKPFCPFGELRKLTLEELPGVKKLPEAVAVLPFLEVVRIIRCPELLELPTNLGECRRLVCLEIEGCDSLESLPESVGELKSLRNLSIHSCPRLEYLPHSLGQLKALHTLLISHLNIVTLPESIWNLEILFLHRLPHVRVLPEIVGQNDTLGRLSVSSCVRLQRMPESLGRLRNLRSMFFTSCPRLEGLPASLEELVHLTTLRIWHCGNIRHLPDGLGQLRSLAELDTRFCKKLETLPESVRRLQSRDGLRTFSCGTLNTWPRLLGQLKPSYMEWLRILNMDPDERIDPKLQLLARKRNERIQMKLKLLAKPTVS